jgi:hypothetical protein
MRREDGVETIYSRREFGKLALVDAALRDVARPKRSTPSSTASDSSALISALKSGPVLLDDAIKAMVQIGIGECELVAGHVEPARPAMPRPQGAASGTPPSASQFVQGQGGRAPSPEMQAAMKKYQEDLRKWRLTVLWITSKASARSSMMPESSCKPTITVSTTATATKRSIVASRWPRRWWDSSRHPPR